MDSLGERIKRFREFKGMTQQTLAERCSVSTSCVSRWETNLLVPKRSNQVKIAAALGIRVDDLYLASEIELPANIVIQEVVKILSEMDTQEQQHVLEYIQLFHRFELLR